MQIFSSQSKRANASTNMCALEWQGGSNKANYKICQLRESIKMPRVLSCYRTCEYSIEKWYLSIGPQRVMPLLKQKMVFKQMIIYKPVQWLLIRSGTLHVDYLDYFLVIGRFFINVSYWIHLTKCSATLIWTLFDLNWPIHSKHHISQTGSPPHLKASGLEKLTTRFLAGVQSQHSDKMSHCHGTGETT